MAYSKTAWTDRAVQYPSRFTMVTNADGTITLTPSPGTITNAGTPITATALNNLENQYNQAVTDIETWVTNQGFAAVSSFAKSFGNSGYQKLPNGMILQWGETQGASPISVNPLPITPPTTIMKAFVSPYSGSASTTATITSKTSQGFSIAHNAASTTLMMWFALTY